MLSCYMCPDIDVSEFLKKNWTTISYTHEKGLSWRKMFTKNLQWSQDKHGPQTFDQKAEGS